ncbi:MAG TPA: hypothetical protein PKK26_03095 [Candidatus Wallbacteria bacterium]|nr:hypothetical protein [Candidatus Wallbacteria bacterium]
MEIDKIVELCTAENMTFAELREDPQFKMLPEEKIRDYIKDLSAIAGSRADKIKSETRNASLADICDSRGVTVNLIDGSGIAANARFRAEIFYDKLIINIMKNSIDQMYNVLKNLSLKYNLKFNFNFDNDLNFNSDSGLVLHKNERFISTNIIKDMHIAHELYHLIEFTDGGNTPDLLPAVTSLKICGFEKKSGILKASEAAAHIFCMRLLDLPFHPKLLDYLCLLDAGEVTRNGLVEFLEEIQMAMK